MFLTLVFLYTLNIKHYLFVFPYLQQRFILSKRRTLKMQTTHIPPCGPIPHNMAKTFDGPPTLDRSGYEHRVGRLHPLSFCKGRGLGSGLKTLPLGRDRWSLLLPPEVTLSIHSWFSRYHFTVFSIPSSNCRLGSQPSSAYSLRDTRINSITHIVSLSVCYISGKIHILTLLSAEQTIHSLYRTTLMTSMFFHSLKLL